MGWNIFKKAKKRLKKRKARKAEKKNEKKCLENTISNITIPNCDSDMETDTNALILEKLCQIAKIDKNDLNYEQSENTCLICHKDFDDTTHKLKCNHSYHYHCILEWYKTCAAKAGFHQNFKKRTCPYCRKDGGWLPLLPDATPLKDVHQEFVYKKKMAKPKPKKKVMPAGFSIGTWTPLGLPQTCQAFLKSNPTKKCTATAHWVGDGQGGFKYCGHHKNYIPPDAAGNPTLVVNICEAEYKSKPGVKCNALAKYGVADNGGSKYCGKHKSLLPEFSKKLPAQPTIIAIPIAS